MASVPDDDEARRLALRLKEARERLGLTTRAFSRLVGIPASTISALERGREPRWSTLMRYLESVPGLRADRLLPASVTHPPAASASLCEHLRREFGQWARSVSVTLSRARGGKATLAHVVEGFETDLVQVSRAETVQRLMQIACIGPRALAARLAPPARRGRGVRVVDGDVTHAFDVPPGGGVRIGYRRTEKLGGDRSFVEHECGYSVSRLTLAAQIPRGRRARLLAWPITRRVEGIGAEIAAYLYPGRKRPRIRRRGDLLSVTLHDVVPGLVHVLDWSEGGPDPDLGLQLAEDPDEEGFAPIARALRARSGLSMRALAEEMKVSHVTVVHAEKGRDPTASTLRRYLASIPGVAPQWLLPAREARGELTPSEAWESIRDLHGLEAASMTRHANVLADGTAEHEEVITDLRTVPGAARGVAVSSLHGKNLYARGHYDIHAIEVSGPEGGEDDDEDDVRTRVERQGLGRPSQVLFIPAAVAGRGLNVRTLAVVPAQFVVTREQVRARHGPTDELALSGLSLNAPIPLRALRCSLQFPPGIHPAEIFPVALPFERPPDWQPLGLLARAPPGSWTWTSQPGGLHVLQVELPLYGLKYGIGWLT